MAHDLSSINHLISTHGILTEFTISKRIPRHEMLKLKNRARKLSKNDKEFEAQMQKGLIEYTRNDVVTNSIPGIILPEGFQSEQDIPSFLNDDNKMMQLSYLSDVIAKKLINSVYERDEVCYVILNLLGMLGISNNDFKKFNKNYEFFDDSLPDDEDDDDFEDGEEA
jgi:hypothetical protein